jgi:cell division protein FtsN
MPLKSLSLIAAVILFGAWGVAHADVPKADDIAACNDEAQEAVRKGEDSRAASPNTKDQSRAAGARRGDAPSATVSGDTRAADPQIEGMDSDGAKDPVYQAAYRTCMRKAGF